MNRLSTLAWMLLAGPTILTYWVLAFTCATLTLRWHFAREEFLCMPIDLRVDLRRLRDNYRTAWRQLLEGK